MVSSQAGKWPSPRVPFSTLIIFGPERQGMTPIQSRSQAVESNNLQFGSLEHAMAWLPAKVQLIIPDTTLGCWKRRRRQAAARVIQPKESEFARSEAVGPMSDLS